MDKKVTLGDYGEQLASEALNATRSNDWYDMKKDMTLNESLEEAEVKTQNRHKFRNEFTVNIMYKNQVEKCTKVKRLFFVEYDETDSIKIWECTDRKYNIFSTRDGRLMAGWPINKMTLIKELIDKDKASYMRSLSQSRDYDKNSPYNSLNIQKTRNKI
jgi:hypothetical protein